MIAVIVLVTVGLVVTLGFSHARCELFVPVIVVCKPVGFVGGNLLAVILIAVVVEPPGTFYCNACRGILLISEARKDSASVNPVKLIDLIKRKSLD